MWTLHFVPRWRWIIWSNTEAIYQNIFFHNPNIYCTLSQRLYYCPRNIYCNVITQWIKMSAHIATSINNILPGSIGVVGCYFSMLIFQFYIADVLGEVLIRPHQYSTYTLPFTIAVTTLNYTPHCTTSSGCGKRGAYINWSIGLLPEYRSSCLLSYIEKHSLATVPTDSL